MTQKDKVKELVGRGLHSYHTKALQQIDRIEKKNKQQNHKISILSNELDNDYLTKTEEGSVVSLEHSKEGMVYLDELQGNTLVNYCTDGSKELTLNGDIDVEGIFVTTTEGVDNGKVDVMCEGNTLVNLNELSKCRNYKSESGLCEITVTTDVTWNEVGVSGKFLVYKLKPNTVYTVFMDIKKNTIGENSKFYLNITAENRAFLENYAIDSGYIGNIIKKVTTRPDLSNVDTGLLPSIKDAKQGQNIAFKYMILEGDWTNREIPKEYFEGMKSVGQDNENGHKIEILSQSSYPNLIKKSKNLSGNGIGSDTSNHNGVQYLIEDNVEFARVSANKQDFSNFYWWLQTVEPRKKGETYTISYDYRCTSDWSGYWYPSESYRGSFFPSTNGEWRRMKITRTVTGGDTKENMLFGVFIRSVEIGDYIDIKNVKMEKGTNDSKWIPSVMDEEFLLAKYSNKKEILLNEPLRKVNDDLKDRFVKIGNKCFIERNCKLQTLNGSEGWRISDGGTQFICNQHRTDALGATNIPIICDKINVTTHQILDNGEGYGINLSYYLRINLRDCDAKNGATVEQFIQRLQANPVTIIYPLKTPTYEPLEINPELFCYNDTTHISNNSIIPCNMKVKNSGYNAIIKPSTLYTVALDTNKSGTIGMNLGGVKGTTTNNVLTLTTPATLTDDSLRLYGKGIKGSKVRLLEGDKTNWVPSFFEGMKSSFEDKVQDDGRYKMEILSNNENLLDLNSKAYKTNFSYDRLIYRSDTNSLVSDIEIGKKIKFKITQHPTYGLAFLIKTIPNKKYTISTKGKCIGGTKQNEVDYFTLAFKTDIDSIETWKNMPAPTDFLREYANIKNVPINTKGSLTFVAKSNYSLVGFCSTYRDWNPSDAPSNDTVIFEFEDIMVTENENVKDFIEHKHNKIQFSSIEPLRGVGNIKDRFVFKDGKLMIERNIKNIVFDGSQSGYYYGSWYTNDSLIRVGIRTNTSTVPKNKYNVAPISPQYLGYKWYTAIKCESIHIGGSDDIHFVLDSNRFKTKDLNGAKEFLSKNPIDVCYVLDKPYYEEISFELQKLILEGYENGTLFFDTNIPPTSTVTYAGETPIAKATKLNKTEVLNNTNDINDNIIPYLMDMDYRVVCLELATETQGISMARLFGGTFQMLQRDILSKRYSVEEYKYRLDAYLSVNKITEKEYEELGEMLNE